MSSEKRQALYDQIRSVLDELKLSYTPRDEAYGVQYNLGGEVPKSFFFYAEERKLTIISKLPFIVPEEKWLEGAIAVAAVNQRLESGLFEYDVETGEILFHQSYFVGDSVLGKTIFHHMIHYSDYSVEQYSMSFLEFVSGRLELSAFLEKIKKN